MTIGKVGNLYPKVSLITVYRIDAFILSQLMKGQKIFVKGPWAVKTIHVYLISENNKGSIIPQISKLKVSISLPHTMEGSCHRLKIDLSFHKEFRYNGKGAVNYIIRKSTLFPFYIHQSEFFPLLCNLVHGSRV